MLTLNKIKTIYRESLQNLTESLIKNKNLIIIIYLTKEFQMN